jgi:hypothetical protein
MSDYRIDTLSRNLANVHSRREALRLLGVGVAGTAVATAGLASTQAKNKKGSTGAQDISSSTLIGIPISAKDNNQQFKGTLTVLEFVEEGDKVVAVSKLVGKVDKPNGKGKKKISRTVRVAVLLPPGVPAEEEAQAEGVQAQATCQLLNLVLGPIDLNLLGLRLQVNQITVNLTAIPGGGLLGDLLCAINNLLAGGAILAQIVGALNNLLAFLRGL